MLAFPNHLVKMWGAEVGWNCEVCGRRWVDGWKLEAHHVIPTYCGGKNTRVNFRLLCVECHYKAHLELRDANVDHPRSAYLVKRRLDKNGGRWK